MTIESLLREAAAGNTLSSEAVHQVAEADLDSLLAVAAELRDSWHGSLVSYSKKVFIPLTQLCRDVCHYCTFAQVPRKLEAAYLTPEQVLESARQAEKAGCREALFTLGDKPELRYRAAREALDDLGFASTLEYLGHVARLVRDETSLLPHLNPGLMSLAEMQSLRSVSASMGIMLESASPRLMQKGMPHHGSPDKDPALRLATLNAAGEAAIPFTSGILIGIGETRRERLDSLLQLRQLHEKWGHLQEIIVQNFRAKPDTLMAGAQEPDLAELLWTLAMARIIFGARMNIQAPPNLSPGVLPQLVAAGINDWGGVSPVTPDFVNPEAPWPQLTRLANETAAAGKFLLERLTIYPEYALNLNRWVDPSLHTAVLQKLDGAGFARPDDWAAGETLPPSAADLARTGALPGRAAARQLGAILDGIREGRVPSEEDIVLLMSARGDDYSHICAAADRLRREVNGDEVTYVVNRNINYTNVCYFKCQFCAFAKGKMSENLRGRPYNLDAAEIMRRSREAWARGASEVCLQGGIHPDYTGDTYIDICRSIKQVVPGMHIHAFSPLEVYQGAATKGVSVRAFLKELKDAGLSTLPGTAAEILDDEVRQTLCADKLNTAQWLEVMQTAHEEGFRTTATIMFGHIEGYEHLARHLLRIRALQEKTGGFNEFVVLPFIHMEAPIYLKGLARKGPTFREAVLIHAVARLTLHPVFRNIQASWTKLGHEGVRACLAAGVNDLGGTLMNETITRAAGASHGQETSPELMEEIIRQAGRIPRQRTTSYGPVPKEVSGRSFGARVLEDPVYTPAGKFERRGGKKQLVRPGEEESDLQLTGSDIV